MTIQRTIDRQQLLRDVESIRRARANPSMEKEHSVEEWLDQIRAAARCAYMSARAGAMAEELDAWIDMAAIAVGRAEFLTALLREEQEQESA